MICLPGELVFYWTATNQSLPFNLNFIDSLHQPTKIYQLWCFFRRYISREWCQGMIQRIPLLSESRELDRHAFGAENNTNLVKRRLPTRGTVLSRFTVTQKPVLAWQVLMACLWLSQIGSQRLWGLSALEGRTLTLDSFHGMLLKPANSRMLKSVSETLVPNSFLTGLQSPVPTVMEEIVKPLEL